MQRSRLRYDLIRTLAAVAVTMAAAAGALCLGGTAPADSGGKTTLDYAFRFASAVGDEKDRAKAQESVVNGYLDLALLDEAEQAAEAIEGWRRGVALGRIAARYARDGQTDRARALLAEAESTAARTQDFGRDRVLAQEAEVRASLGEGARSKEIAEQLRRSDPKTYGGRATVAEALAQAGSGDLDGAVATIATLDDEVDLYVTWWRTEGYLELARRPGLDAERRAAFLQKARESVGGIDGWKQAEMLQELARALDGAGRREDAEASLRTAEGLLLELPPTMSLKGPLLADLARSWGELGQSSHALELMATAETSLGRVTSIVERPAAIARVAAAYSTLGRDEDAERLLNRALDLAEALENPRPRALALSALCRETGRSDITLEAGRRTRLDQLLAGLAAPEQRAGL